MTNFFKDIAEGQKAARDMLRRDPRDASALFYLGKLDLNFVWLQLGPLGRKTGWEEYLGGTPLIGRRAQGAAAARPRAGCTRVD